MLLIQDNTRLCAWGQLPVSTEVDTESTARLLPYAICMIGEVWAIAVTACGQNKCQNISAHLSARAVGLEFQQ